MGQVLPLVSHLCKDEIVALFNSSEEKESQKKTIASEEGKEGSDSVSHLENFMASVWCSEAVNHFYLESRLASPILDIPTLPPNS